MSVYVGDFDAGDVIRRMFNTRDTAGAPIALDPGSPTPLIVFRDDFLGHDLSGLTLEIDHGSPALVGLNLVEVDTSADPTFFANGRDFFVVLQGGTVDGVSVEGVVVAHFSLRNRSVELDRPLSSHTAVGSMGQRLQAQRSGTAQAGAVGSITLDASASAVDDFYNDQVVQITSGTGVGQARVITNYVGSSKVASVSPNWATTPDGTSVFQVLPSGAGSITGTVNANVVSHDAAALAEIEGEVEDALQAQHLDHLLAQPYDANAPVGDPTSLINRLVEPDNSSPQQPRFTATALEQAPTGGGDSAAVIADAVWDEARSGHVAGGSFGEGVASVQGNVTGSAASVSGAVGSVTGNVGGNVTGSVGSLATQAKADVNAEVVEVLTVDVVADSIPADGSRPTIAQAAYMLTQFLLERSVSGTTLTVKKPDGTTTLFTLSLNHATTPTIISRAT